MSVLELKMKVLQQVMQTESQSLLSRLESILTSYEQEDFVHELNEPQIAAIKKGIKEAEEGKVVDWDKAMDRLDKK